MSSTRRSKAPARRNPYRGPREFTRKDHLPNRQREARELTDLLVAERIVLLHSPSGAGKTSLIEAALVRELQLEGFYATPRLRLNEPPQPGRTYNRYIHSLVMSLLRNPGQPEPPDNLTLSEAVEQWRPAKRPADLRTVLILDQFEESLVLDPTDWDAKEELFRALGALVSTEPLWMLLSMREDYMGGLDRYFRFIPGLLRARYRLDFLSRPDAILAIQIPARQQQVDFRLDAATALADRLAVVQVEQPGKVIAASPAPYVEPFQLQVVCKLLWENVSKKRGPCFSTLEVSDVKRHADIEQALTLYYGRTISDVVRATSADERTIRDWVETELITKQEYRSQTLSLPATDKPEQVVAFLENAYLIRSDVRGPHTWRELSHDRLVGPILSNNQTWRWATLEPWQIAAVEWSDRGRSKELLMRTEQLPRVMPDGSSGVERDFIAACEENEVRRMQRNAMSMLRSMVIVEAVVIILLVITVIVT
jgi:hypothetical protein